jgi:2-methylcitrate dehydratase PrpD
MNVGVTTPPALAESIAQWVARLHWRDVPDVVRHSLRDGLLQSIAGGVAGLDMPETKIVLDMARQDGEPGFSTIYGDGLKVPAGVAVFVNGLMFCALEQQEMHVASGTHPYQTIVPATLVVAERMTVSGEEFMTAVLAGTEVMLALSIAGMSITEGWGMETSHTSAVYGAIGTAVAIAKLMRLDELATTRAMGHAANLAAGLTEGLWFGTTEYHWALANGARVGHLAALLARSGAEVAPTILEGRAGFFHRFSEIPEDKLNRIDFVEKVSGRLGRVWETPQHIYKRYPIHFNNLPYVDAARLLRQRHAIRPEAITAIRLTLNRWCLLCDGGNLGPYRGREATRGATPFGVAMMLARGHYTLDDATEPSAPEVAALVAKTTILTYDDPLVAGDWRSLHIEIDAPETFVYDGKVDGVPNYRLGTAELRAIADDALSRVLGTGQTAEVLDALLAIESLSDMKELIALLVSRRAQS